MTAPARRTGPTERLHPTGPGAGRAPSPEEPREHERLGPYRLLQRLGEGGMGVVHLALDPQGRAVAVKVLRPHIAYDPEARSRLEREVDTLSRVVDARVAAVIDSDIFGERPYLVTRYVPGPSLDEVVTQEGPLRGADLLRLGCGLVEALQAIHAVGVVHRDLKPGNVLLEDGEPVLIDFGIAHVADDVRLTSVGLVMGTPGYLSPEVVAGGRVTEATDWWGWAATLAYAASGHPPFGRGPMNVVLDRVRRAETDLSGVDAHLRPLLEAALAPDPLRRPPVDEVVAALELYAAGKPATVAVPQAWAQETQAQPQVGQPAAPLRPAPLHTSAWPVEEPVESAVEDHRSTSSRWADEAERRWGGRWPAPQGEPVVPAGPAGPAQAWGPTGYAAYDDPHAPGYEPEPAHQGGEQDPRTGRPMRSGTLAVGVAALAAASMSWPGVVVLVVVGWCLVARFSDRLLSALVVRRFQRGRRRSDVPRAVVTSPWHLLGAAIGTVVSLALPALVAAAGVVCAALGLAAAVVGPGGSAMEVVGPALAAGFLVGALVAWWGPGGASLRRGSRSMVRTLVPEGVATQVLVTAFSVATVVLGSMAVARAGQVSWWPWTGDPIRALLGL